MEREGVCVCCVRAFHVKSYAYDILPKLILEHARNVLEIEDSSDTRSTYMHNSQGKCRKSPSTTSKKKCVFVFRFHFLHLSSLRDMSHSKCVQHPNFYKCVRILDYFQSVLH